MAVRCEPVPGPTLTMELQAQRAAVEKRACFPRGRGAAVNLFRLQSDIVAETHPLHGYQVEFPTMAAEFQLKNVIYFSPHPAPPQASG